MSDRSPSLFWAAAETLSRRRANLTGADLSGADLGSAGTTGATGLSDAFCIAETTWPDGNPPKLGPNNTCPSS